MSEIVLTTENYDLETQTEVPVLIDFWATWCGPCRMIAGEVEKIAEKFDGKVKVCKVNVDEQMLLAEKYNVAVIPTLVLLKDGEEVKRSTGYMSCAEIEKTFNL